MTQRADRSRTGMSKLSAIARHVTTLAACDDALETDDVDDARHVRDRERSLSPRNFLTFRRHYCQR
ncbi:hypothetical protein CH256_22510 [Rhodococcus sp. 05-2254-6]|nr:hypothetical protein CH256_22510 [Rhodococcus sp. 05-2254-6]